MSPSLSPEVNPQITAKLRTAPTSYDPIARLAVGGMAEVWRANAMIDGNEVYPVAIKRVLPSLENQELYRSMFEDEARLGMLLRHPNIVRVYDARAIGGTFIMVMELIDGSSLRNLLRQAHARRACMPLAVALHIARQIARALAYAHSAMTADGTALGIVHRDVSPHNVLLSKHGSVKLADFGLANASVHETATDLVGGKFGYMAPEVVRHCPGDHRIDIFALGIVLFEMLAGRRLFRGENETETIRAVARCEVPDIREINPKVPASVQELLGRLLDPDPDARVQRAEDAEASLGALIEEIDSEVGPRDVALLVGLYLANAELRPSDVSGHLDVARLLGQELRQFAEAAAGASYDLGASPLDPGDFDRQVLSGERP